MLWLDKSGWVSNSLSELMTDESFGSVCPGVSPSNPVSQGCVSLFNLQLSASLLPFMRAISFSDKKHPTGHVDSDKPLKKQESLLVSQSFGSRDHYQHSFLFCNIYTSFPNRIHLGVGRLDLNRYEICICIWSQSTRRTLRHSCGSQGPGPVSCLCAVCML